MHLKHYVFFPWTMEQIEQYFFKLFSNYIIFYYNFCRGGLWLLDPKDERTKAQRAQYNKFVESGMKG